MTIFLGFLFFFFQAQPGGGGIIGLFLPMIVVFAIFYLLVIRPQQKKQRLAQSEREQMLGALRPGDKVITTGGIYGSIVSVRETSVHLKISQGVSIEVLRTAIAGLQSDDIKEVEPVK